MTDLEDDAAARLYLITPPQLPDLDRFCDALRAAFDGGDVACLQLRLKAADGVGAAAEDDVLRAADALLPIAAQAGAALLINDSAMLAKRAGADGVHLGQSDGSLQEARALLGDGASIGATCHASIDLGFHAGEAGADYVAFGAFFPTVTKEASTRAEPGLLRQWAEATVLPSVAIGGITPANCGPLVAAGADFLAASHAVWADADGPGAAVAKFNKAIFEAA